MPGQPASLLALPANLRNKIYGKVLCVGHPLYIFQDTGLPIELFAPDKPPHWLALCYTNRQVSKEASTVLFTVNTFVFEGTEQRQVSELRNFLSCVGPTNASALSRLCITFPVIERRPGGFGLSETGHEAVKLLQERCNSLIHLEGSVRGENFEYLMKLDQEGFQVVQKALSQFDRELKAILSLQNFVVRFCYGEPSSSLLKAMHQLGWTTLL